MIGHATAAGACGELVQGQINPGTDFLISLPIDLYARARVEIKTNTREILCFPNHKTKSCLAVRAMLDHYDIENCGAAITITSQIPESKGMASSTADITAVCRATSHAIGVKPEPNLIAAIARKIEPSDGTMYTHPVMFNHRQGELLSSLGPLPEMDVLTIDLGGKVDTLDHNKEVKQYTQNEIDQFIDLYTMVACGIKANDATLIGRAATMSANLNQRFIFKAALKKLISIVNTYGAYGVCAAHSGTVVGILLDKEQHPIKEIAATVRSSIHPHALPGINKTI